MQSFWFGLIGILSLSALSTAVPVSSALEESSDAETRIIIPPELPPLHFQLLKEKSENQIDHLDDKGDRDSTPLNFLKSLQGSNENISAVIPPHPIAIIDSNKQTPIYITIPIHISTGYPVPSRVAIDNGAVIETPMFRKAGSVSEETPVPADDLRKAFTGLFLDAYKQYNQHRNLRNKKRAVPRVRPLRIYRN